MKYYVIYYVSHYYILSNKDFLVYFSRISPLFYKILYVVDSKADGILYLAKTYNVKHFSSIYSDSVIA